MSLTAIPIPPSTNIAQVQYDGETGDLFITFVKGATYRYSDVPADVATRFNTPGQSAGKYFRANILNQYLGEEV